VLAVGTTHPLHVAGIGLDVRIAERLGVRVVSVVAGVSAQSARRVLARRAVDDELIAAQFAALADIAVDAIHIGALVDARSVAAVAAGVAGFAGVPIVCDPVIAASGGDRLADDATVAALRDVLFPRCALVTPNLDEAGLLLDWKPADADAMERAARELRAGGAAAVLVKGGHLPGDPVDVLVWANGTRHFVSPRLALALRGTGDLLAAAISAGLAYGAGIERSVAGARTFVRACIEDGVTFADARTVP
jgi:hydroxymethylpyrimidine/phosphomethylpyrimidine kinase